MWSDVRLAFRSLRKRPGFTGIVLFTLALGIGANSAIFSVVNAVLLAPLPYKEPARVAALFAVDTVAKVNQKPLSFVNFQDFRSQCKSCEQMSALRPDSFSFVDGEEPERLNGVRVSPGMLGVLGLTPLTGRNFLPQEELPGKGDVALISYGFWQRRYGGNPLVSGRKVSLEGRPFTIIGVLPRGVRYAGLLDPPGGADIWIPFVPRPNEQVRGFANIRVLCRLNPTVTPAQAQIEMNLIASRLERSYPADNAGLKVILVSLTEVVTGRVRLGLWILLGAVGIVLLIACVNVANLMLARAAGRETEIAIRRALGSSRWRLVRQMLIESQMLSLVAGGIGLIGAWLCVTWLTKTNVGNIPRVEEISLNTPVVGFTLLISLVTTLFCGLLPALRASAIISMSSLGAGRKGVTANANQTWLNSLAIAEIGLALVLLVGAGLLFRSFHAVTNIDPGFRSDGILTVPVPLPLAKYPDQESQLRFFEKALEGVASIPGVDSSGAVFRLPMVGFAMVTYTVENQPVPPEAAPSAHYRPMSPAYMRTMEIKLVKGRDFTEHDTAKTPLVVIVNEEFARRHWPGENPIGRRLDLMQESSQWREVVGIADNARITGLEEPVEPAIYVPLAQNTLPNALANARLVVHTKGNMQGLASALRQKIGFIDPTLPITQIRPMKEIVNETLAPRRFNMMLLLIFAAVAGSLAVVGIYGVISYSVATRKSEIGVRVALGAGSKDILKLILGRGMKITAAGIILGWIGAISLTRIMKGLLFSVSPLDPTVFGCLTVLLIVTTILASYIPARRASQMEPVAALKEE